MEKFDINFDDERQNQPAAHISDEVIAEPSATLETPAVDTTPAEASHVLAYRAATEVAATPMDGEDWSKPLNPPRQPEDYVLHGFWLDDHTFVARVPFFQLRLFAPDPRDLEDPKKLQHSEWLQKLSERRKGLQRSFTGEKGKNVPRYAGYQVDVHRGHDGIVPPINFWSQERLQVDVDDHSKCGTITVPHGALLVAIDGETELAARNVAAIIEPGTENDFVILRICHDRPKAWARQAFRDMNACAVRPNAAVCFDRDARDPITDVAREVEKRVPFFTDRVSKDGRLAGGPKGDLVTITLLRNSCLTLSEGISGLARGRHPLTLSDEKRSKVVDCAVDYFRAVTDAIGPAIEDRKHYLASSPPVLAAIGAMGNVLLFIDDPAERAEKRDQLVAMLSEVDWSRAPHWLCVGAKLTKKGDASIGGSKETAHAVLDALSNPASTNYQKIRPTLIDTTLSEVELPITD